MQDLDVGAMPICSGEQLSGILTDRDITVRATAEGRDPAKTKVSDVMSPEVAYCFEDQEIEEAVSLMEVKQIRRLPILNREKKLVGIVTLGDLAVQTGNERLAGEALKEVSEPATPRR
jgi:CBS domain-containing protein